MPDQIRAIIIDDEQLARNIIKSYLIVHPEIKLVGIYSNGLDGLKAIQELQPDLVFLDVMMPKINGFEMLELLESAPVIVFSTAHDQYAIKAFETNAIDYLLKPYSQERFNESIIKVKEKVNRQESSKNSLKGLLRDTQNAQEQLQRVVVKVGSKIHILAVDKIRYIEAMDDYVRLHTKESKYLKQQTMKYYEAHLPAGEFVRIHRSYILNVKEIFKLEPYGKDTHVAILKDQMQLPISRSGYAKLKNLLRF